MNRAGCSVWFSIGQASLGWLLVATTEKGPCAIFLGDRCEDLEKNLEKSFPKATLTRDERSLQQVMAAVTGLMDHPRRGFDLPLDEHGTEFQRRVWKALREIPAGTTLSYRQVAERIGSPGADRAVAGACASNRLAVVIPCHRVVRSDGSLGGYRWGIERKRALLEREANLRPSS